MNHCESLIKKLNKQVWDDSKLVTKDSFVIPFGDQTLLSRFIGYHIQEFTAELNNIMSIKTITNLHHYAFFSIFSQLYSLIDINL